MHKRIDTHLRYANKPRDLARFVPGSRIIFFREDGTVAIAVPSREDGWPGDEPTVLIDGDDKIRGLPRGSENVIVEIVELISAITGLAFEADGSLNEAVITFTAVERR